MIREVLGLQIRSYTFFVAEWVMVERTAALRSDDRRRTFIRERLPEDASFSIFVRAAFDAITMVSFHPFLPAASQRRTKGAVGQELALVPRAGQERLYDGEK